MGQQHRDEARRRRTQVDRGTPSTDREVGLSPNYAALRRSTGMPSPVSPGINSGLSPGIASGLSPSLTSGVGNALRSAPVAQPRMWYEAADVERGPRTG